ncbi:MAG: double-strand break repair protein AddB [Paracoccaceae bacterium]
MFETGAAPRVFGCPPGADFPRHLVHGLSERMSAKPPEEMARVEIFVNTRRMQRRIVQLFDEGPALLLPRIRLVADLAQDPAGADLLPAVSNLQRRLELSQLIRQLLDAQPDLAPRVALFDLADSLAQLMAEMQDEGVLPEVIRNLNVADRSGYWQRSLMFLDAVARYFGSASQESPDAVARNRQVVERMVDRWRDAPPQHPVLVAGSTGSRGTTALLMQAVARLPQGAIVLPGFDFDLPAAVWDRLDDALTAEDHPQYRFAKFLRGLDMPPAEVGRWRKDAIGPAPERNRLVSLALRPAPVTDQWMTEGPAFVGVDVATRGMTLIEAPSSRVEAVAIATILRKAAEDGRTAALVTPDRTLTRQVTVALDRWGIEPDVSVGDPLPQTAVGRLLRHISDLFGQKLTAERLLVLLKHPMVNSAGADRGQHLLWTFDLELHLRRYGPPFPAPADLLSWAAKHLPDDGRVVWAAWLADVLTGLDEIGAQPASQHLSRHLALAHAFVEGPSGADTGTLWATENGRVAQRLFQEFQAVADHAGELTPADYRQLVMTVLAQGEVRDPVRPHPGIMIWGTLEARVQGANLIVLGGLNDGIWPDLPAPDPWLNREMRLAAGLLLPERRVGLSAHDFQQAIAAAEVVLTRSVRSDEAETVASRWLNRLGNLMRGMSGAGEAAYTAMRDRGQVWLDLVDRLETPTTFVNPEPRPSPQPPVEARPKSLSVTAIARLIRDPYAIYAENVLRLRRLDPLHHQPDAPLRGTVLHKVMEEFIRGLDLSQGLEAARMRLMLIADDVLKTEAPWPAARVLWKSKLERVADRFLADEVVRQSKGSVVLLEEQDALHFPEVDFTLKAKVDRIDKTPEETFIIYDYKTGAPPTRKQLDHFDKQLLLEAMMAEAGAFRSIGAAPVSAVAHIGLGAKPVFDPIELEHGQTAEVREQFVQLIREYLQRDQGYTSRRAMAELRHSGDFDHLARYGEWDESQGATGVWVGP